MAVSVPPTRRVDGDSQFLRGMNSKNSPNSLPEGFYRSAMNLVNRGGVLQTRPGYDFKFNMPTGNLQGSILFRPTNGFEYLVFAVAGKVYSSQYPFQTYERVIGLTFRDDVTDIYFCACEKGSQVQEDETVKLITPYRLLVIQDGFSPPGIWDGSSAQVLTSASDTPIGTAMAWSGNRLWVARDQEIFASDIFDPVSFREGTYLSNAKSFLVEKNVSAMAEVTTKSDGQLLVFTDTSAWLFQSNVRKRSDWGSTATPFQALLLPEIGCIAHRSLVTMHGLLWWYSAFGLTNLDAASSTFISSEFKFKDGEMALSKGLLSPRQSSVAAAVFENYLLVSVPFADQFNSHTWVMDKSPGDTLNEDSPDAWNCYWVGTRPVSWAFGFVQGVSRVFQFSKDFDGNNRCWEAFGEDRNDMGAPITWSLETRGYTDKNISFKKFRFAELELSELSGVVDIASFWAGATRGAYKRCLTKRIEAAIGTIDSDIELDYDESVLYSLKKQSRTLYTIDVQNADTEKTSCNVESDKAEWIDRGFQLFITGSGEIAVNTLRMFLDQESEPNAGACEKDETKDNFVRFDGAGSEDLVDLNDGPVIFTSTKTVTVTFETQTYDSVASASSYVSQQDADKIALAKAQAQADYWYAIRVGYMYGDPSAAI